MNRIPPPATLCLAGCIIAFMGGSELGNTICRNLTGGRGFIGLGMIGIPLGAALLRGSATARRLTLLLGTVMGLFLLWIWLTADRPGWPHETVAPLEWLFLTPEIVVMGLVVAAPLLLLLPRCRQWFRLSEEERASAAWWAWPLSIAGLLYAIAAADGEYREHKVAKEVFPVDTTFSVHREDTGEPLHGFGASLPPVRTGDASSPRLRISFRSGNYHIEGVSIRPFSVRFHAEGFEGQAIEITRGTPARVKVEMKSAR
ncbi:MAG TPA: hypothetical protein VG796_21370 [Verrucomicrobiales bacterium]|nr:hypothetical protein [Verrucomicrobiales bacterium]